MEKKIIGLLGILLFLGCAGHTPVKRTDAVTLLLKNGDKIKADVLDILPDKIVFRTNDWEKAYEYGEVLILERIKEIELADGTRLSVEDYDRFRQGGELQVDGKKAKVKFARMAEEELQEGDFQYDEIKNKPISEMTDNEFRYFMMMKDRELLAENAASKGEEVKSSTKAVVPGEKSAKTKEATANNNLLVPSETISKVPFVKLPQVERAKKLQASAALNKIENKELVNSLLEAGLAASYLRYLEVQPQLSATESRIRELILNHPQWQEKTEEIEYIDHVAQKTLSRAYLFNPDDLQTKLGLSFDPDLDMDYLELMAQLNRKIGNDVKMVDYRKFVDVFGESGGLAIKELLENYDTWQFIMQKRNVASAR
ncbi:MAG: hypothetical protein ACE5HS_07185 [bacterium]